MGNGVICRKSVSHSMIHPLPYWYGYLCKNPASISVRHGRRLGTEFGGTEKFLGPNFRITFLKEKFRFHAENLLVIHCIFVFLCCLKPLIP